MKEGIDRAAFRALMRHVPGQVSIIAAGAPGLRNGLTASAVCSLTDLPPTVLVCVNKAAAAHDLIIKSKFFSVNALTASQERIGRVFAGQGGVRGDARFSVGDWLVGLTGAPILASALCRLECCLSVSQPTSSHTVIFGHVIAGSASPRAAPLLYHRGAYLALDQERAEMSDALKL